MAQNSPKRLKKRNGRIKKEVVRSALSAVSARSVHSVALEDHPLDLRRGPKEQHQPDILLRRME
jgi:hypothetical protein